MDQKRKKKKNEVTVCLVWRWKPNENVTEANSLKAFIPFILSKIMKN